MYCDAFHCPWQKTYGGKTDHSRVGQHSFNLTDTQHVKCNYINHAQPVTAKILNFGLKTLRPSNC